ncbi:hypothetical protein OAE03_03040 [Winogradskyella sp.]|nr:hypothetical protein [Winogradskyella sp.]
MAAHGLFLSLEKYTFSALKIKTFNAFGYLYTFIVVIVAWIFFRAPDFESAATIVSTIFSFDFGSLFLGDINKFVNAVLLLTIGVAIDLRLFKSKVSLEEFGVRFSTIRLTIIVSIIILLLCLFYSTTENFIYFQF